MVGKEKAGATQQKKKMLDMFILRPQFALTFF